RCMTISLRMPRVSGSRVIFAGSSPAMHAAACRISPALAPAVTKAASAPSMRAIAAPAASFSSSTLTSTADASRIASSAPGRRRELVAVELALLVRLHVGGALPQTHREARVLVLRVLEQPAPAQPFDLAALGRHRLPIRLLEVVPRAGPELPPRHAHDHLGSSFVI